MSNFGFLQGQTEYAMFANAAIEAEKVYSTSSAMCAIGCRKAMELAVKWVYAADNTISMPYSDNLQSMIHEPTFRYALDRNTWGKLPYIVKLGNLAVHTEKSVRPEDVILSLKGLFEFVQWIDYCYGADYEERTFDEAAIPKERVALDVAKIKEQESLISTQEATIKTMEAKLAAMAKELTAARLVNQEGRTFAAESISEYQTRKRYIDLDMKMYGWIFSGTGQNVSEEFEISDMNAVLGQKGYVDYVLWGENGLPLAIVEAKRTSKDPNNGKKQAMLYADALERRFKRRPFIFYTNGFETYFWSDKEAPPRLVGAIFSREDLERLMNRRSSATDPGNQQINENIAGRYYQIEAIRAICDNFNKKFRKNLLVMATGTGKTRTAAALTDVFSKSGQATNILFLADRVGLVKQAKDSFKEYLPQMSLCNLCENKKDINARIVFSTYPTILNAIDEVKSKDGIRMFSPAHFDMIIIDEAHRSIFKKYRAIFEYFDAVLVGLTATPKVEVDHNTYEFFELEDNVPTFAYEYDQAIKDHFLVPYYNFEVSTTFMTEGITYDDLSEEDKKRYEDDFTEDGVMPDHVEETKINKKVFNQETVDTVLNDLMTRGIKVNGGDLIGKTIIFAENKRHAQYIIERFDKLYPQYNGVLAQRVVCDDSYAQSVIDDFKVPDKPPFIAVSVDMMDTGIDVPECVNLVFFKKVRSRAKFWQMIGRGTRLRKGLNCYDDIKGKEYDDKEYFLIFDYGGNFEFFRQHKEGYEGKDVKTLTETIFDKQIHIIAALQEARFTAEKYQQWRSELIDICHGQIMALNDEQAIVRSKRRYVERYKEKAVFNFLSAEDISDLCKYIAPLVHRKDDDEYAKRFDNFMYGLILAYIENSKNYPKASNDLVAIADALTNKTTIPQVKAQLPQIKAILSDDYWNNPDVLVFEQTRKDLRSIIQFLFGTTPIHIITTMLADPIIGTTVGKPLPGTNEFENYRKKVNRFIEEHPDNLAIYKLKRNVPLTDEELKGLQDTFLHKLGSEADYKKEFGDTPLGLLIRKLAGMDEEAVRAEFASFINKQRLNQQQIVFLDKIINHILNNGYVDTPQIALTKAPFDRPYGLFALFEVPQVMEIMQIVNSFTVNAAI